MPFQARTAEYFRIRPDDVRGHWSTCVGNCTLASVEAKLNVAGLCGIFFFRWRCDETRGDQGERGRGRGRELGRSYCQHTVPCRPSLSLSPSLPLPLSPSPPLSHPHALCLATTTAGSAAAYGIAAPRLASPRITAHHMATVVCMCSGTRQAAETDSNAGFGGTVHRFYSSADRIDLSHSAGSSESAQHSHHVVERKAAALAGSS